MKAKSAIPNLSRRRFVVSSAAAGGGLALGLHVPFAFSEGAVAAHRGRSEPLGRDTPGRYVPGAHRARRDGAGHAHGPRPARRRRARMRLVQGAVGPRDPGTQPRGEARVGRDGHRRQPRHPHLERIRAPGRRGGAPHAAAGRSERMERSCRRAVGGAGRDSPRAVGAIDDLREGRGGRIEAARARSQDPQAQGRARLEDRRQAAEAPRHGAEARRQQGVFDRRAPAGNAQCRHQAMPGVRRHRSLHTTRRRSRRCRA